jgi:hypothetical protein
VKLWHLCALLLIVGCRLPQIKPDINLLKANEDVNAVKNVGDIAPLKGKLEAVAEVTAPVGVGNEVSSTRNNVGGNMSSNNDTELLKKNLEIYEALTERYIKLMRYIIYGLLSVIVLLITNDRRRDDALLKMQKLNGGSK